MPFYAKPSAGAVLASASLASIDLCLAATAGDMGVFVCRVVDAVLPRYPALRERLRGSYERGNLCVGGVTRAPAERRATRVGYLPVPLWGRAHLGLPVRGWDPYSEDVRTPRRRRAYQAAAAETASFAEILAMLRAGEKILLLDSAGPTITQYPAGIVADGETLRDFADTPMVPYSHEYALALLLLAYLGDDDSCSGDSYDQDFRS